MTANDWTLSTSAIVVKRKRPPVRRSKHLYCRCRLSQRRTCASSMTMATSDMLSANRGNRRQATRSDQSQTRWVVEVCHSWFNRFPQAAGAIRSSNAASSLRHPGHPPSSRSTKVPVSIKPDGLLRIGSDGPRRCPAVALGALMDHTLKNPTDVIGTSCHRLRRPLLGGAACSARERKFLKVCPPTLRAYLKALRRTTPKSR